MQRPWKRLLPRKGVEVLRGGVAWRFWSERTEWGSPMRYAWMAVGTRPPLNWRYLIQQRSARVKKPGSAPGEKLVRPDYFDDDTFAMQYPHLFEALAASGWEDGTPKGPGVLIIKGRNRVVSCTLKIDGTGLMFRWEAPNVAEAFTAGDAALGTGEAPWEEDPYAGGNGGRKKK